MVRRWMGWILGLLLCFAASSALADSYATYRERYVGVPDAEETILLYAREYSAEEGTEALADGAGLETGETGFVEWTAVIPQDALYTVRVRYFPGAGSGGDMLRAFSVNGEIPFDEAGELAFSRMWNDASRDYQSVSGNQPFPSQVQTPRMAGNESDGRRGLCDGGFPIFPSSRGKHPAFRLPERGDDPKLGDAGPAQERPFL